MDFYGFSGLDPDAPKRAPENLDPKTRMLGVAPALIRAIKSIYDLTRGFVL